MSDRETTPRDRRTSQKRRGPVRRHRPGLEGLEGRQLLSYGGSPDLSYGTNGVAILQGPNLSPDSTIFSVEASALETDGKTVVAALESITPLSGAGSEEVVIARFNADGTPDTTFGTGGYFTGPSLAVDTPIDYGAQAGATALAVQPDGSIVVAGVLTSPAEVFRVTSAGALDTTFGTNGFATLGTPGASDGLIDDPEIVAIRPDGTIAVGGGVGNPYATGYEPAVTVLNANGSTDTSFGTSGMATVPLPTGETSFEQVGDAYFMAGGMAVQPDGKIVFVASASDNTGGYVGRGNLGVVTRFDADGTLDTTFGTGGQVSLVPTSILGSGNSDQLSQVAIQADGKIVVGGSFQYTGVFAALAVRLNADGSFDDTFGIGGADIIGSSTLSSIQDVTAMVVEPDGQILLGDPSNPRMVRLDANGLPDTTFGSDALIEIPHPVGSFDSEVKSIGLLPDGEISVVLSGIDNTLTHLIDQGSGGDYDNDGTSDPAVYDTTTATFTDAPSGGGTPASTVIGDPGAGLTLPASGAYNGNGISEVAVYRVGSGTFDVKPYTGGPDVITAFGIPGIGNTLPAPGDYDGSGQTELAVYLPQYAEFAYRPADGGLDQYVPLGIAGAGQSIPAEADYFGTGRDDFAVYLPAIGAFEIKNPVNGAVYTIPFGTPGAGNSIPVPGDYDGSGHDELAVYLPASGDLIYRPADGGADVTIPIGTPGVAASIPEVGDFDGSSHDEAAVYNPATGTFVYQPAAGGSPVSISLGTAGETVPFSLGTDSVAEEGTGAPSGSAGGLALPATVEVPLTQDVLDTLDGLNLKKKAGQA